MSVVTDPKAMQTPRQANRRRQPIGSKLLGLLAWLIGLTFVFPVLWMVLTSFHKETDAATNPPSFFAPLSTEGYQSFFSAGPLPPLINSATASIMSTILVLLLAFPAAYALSIKPVRKWTDVLFFFLSTKFLPVVAGLLPIYLFAQQVNLLDNINLLVLFYTVMNLPIAVWMLRSFLAEVPVEMLEQVLADEAFADLAFLATAEEHAVWHHDPHPADVGFHRCEHVLDPGEVSVLGRRETADDPLVRVLDPRVGAPVLK